MQEMICFVYIGNCSPSLFTFFFHNHINYIKNKNQSGRISQTCIL